MNRPVNPIFLDIETGGLEAQGKRASSILSISMEQGGIVSEIFSHPTPGTWVSEFSKQQILPQVQQAAQTHTEKEGIQHFIKSLHAAPRAPIVGYNIKGFDVPFLYQRAEQFGLGEDLRSAMAGRRQIDIGLRVKSLVAESISEHIDRGTFRQQLGTETWGQAVLKYGQLPYEQRPPEFRMLSQMRSFAQQAAESPENVLHKQARGWKLEQIFSLFAPEDELVKKAHQSTADVQMTRRLFEALPKGELQARLADPEFAQGWLKSTVESLGRTMDKDAGEFYHPSLRGRATAAWSRIPVHGRRLIGGAGIAAGALATVGIVNSLFSGKDDAYNTIEGLGHSGLGQVQRRSMTDFGSGYQGDLRYAGDIIREQLGDQLVEPEEFRDLVKLIRSAADERQALELITPKEARNVYDTYLNWKDPEMANLAKLSISESPEPGLFGLYWPGKDELEIKGYQDPDDLVSTLGLIRDNVDQENMTGALNWFYKVLNPDSYLSTVVHEGLHAVWEKDLSTTEKDVFRDYFFSNVEDAFMEGTESDVTTLIRKAPVYAHRAARAWLTGDESDVDLVATELFAHLGESYFEASQFAGNKETRKIVEQYIDPSRPQLGKPFNIAVSFEEGPEVYRNIIRDELSWWDITKANYRASSFFSPGSTPFSFSGKDDAYNTVEGLDHRGIASELRRLNTDFASPVDLLKATQRAQQLYKGKMSQLLGKKNINWMEDISEEGSGYALSLVARDEKGQMLMGVSRVFEKEGIDLTSIEIASQLRGGIGKKFYDIEPEIFRDIGYTTGEKITSPVASPITARWQMQQYGSRINPLYEGQTGIGHLPDLERRIMQKQVPLEEMPGLTMTGFIPDGHKPPSMTQHIQQQRVYSQNTKIKHTAQQAAQIERQTTSGNDDLHNTVEAFGHGGLAGKLRKMFGFGSGARGIIKIPEILAKHSQVASYGASGRLAYGEKIFAEYVRDFNKANASMKAAGPVALPKKVQKFGQDLMQAQEAGYQHAVFINTAAIQEAAKRTSVAEGFLLKHTIAHERVHYARQLMRGDEPMYAMVPEGFITHMATSKAYKDKPVIWAEEYLANVAAVTKYPQRTQIDPRVASVMMHSSVEELARAQSLIGEMEKFGTLARREKIQGYRLKQQQKKVRRAALNQKAIETSMKAGREGGRKARM